VKANFAVLHSGAAPGHREAAGEDSTQPHYLEQELYENMREGEGPFEWLQAGSLDGVWYWDLEHPEHEWMSDRFWQTLGYDPAEMPHLAAAWQAIVHSDDLALALKNLERHCEDPSHSYDQIVRYRHKEGHTVWVRCRGLAIRDKNGTPLRMLGAHTIVTAQKEAELALARKNEELEKAKKQLEHLALYDALTGLGNRNLFLRQLEHLMAIAGHRDEEVALLVMDLNGFKDVNDRLGHAAGDLVLQEFSSRLNQALRRAEQKYRIGGDEFAVLLDRRHKNHDRAVGVAEQIARQLEDPMEIKGQAFSISVSIGIAIFPEHGQVSDVLLRKADAAMYEAKKRGQVVAEASDQDATSVLRTLNEEIW